MVTPVASVMPGLKWCGSRQPANTPISRISSETICSLFVYVKDRTLSFATTRGCRSGVVVDHLDFSEIEYLLSYNDE